MLWESIEMLFEELHILVVLRVVEVANLQWKKLGKCHLCDKQEHTDQELKLEVAHNHLQEEKKQGIGIEAHMVEDCISLIQISFAREHLKTRLITKTK